MATGHKTVYAEKGIVVRVQVAEEIWAGESRPIYAVLNGKYNDGAAKCGDVPWTYPIQWQFAEPVWEEEGTGEDITYTPRPPDESQGEEYIPSTILTGAHRVKHNTSPLYLGDMTSTAGGFTYARAIITGVNVSGGEVVQGTGSQTITSVWVPVACVEEVYAVTLDGVPTDEVAMFKPDDGTERGEAYFEHADPMQSLTVILDAPLDTGTSDTIRMSINHEAPIGYVVTELVETGNDTKTFEDAGETITLVISNYAGLDDEAIDSFDATVTHVLLSISAETRTVTEIAEDSSTFAARTYSAVLHFPWEPTSSVMDHFMAQILRLPSGPGTSTLFSEDGAACSRYINYGGSVLVEITSPLDWSPDVRDTITISVSSSVLDLQGAQLELTETADNSMVFADHFLMGYADGDPLEPTELTLVKARARRWPAIFGEKYPYGAITPFDYKEVECRPVAGGMLESVLPLVVVGPGYADQMQSAMTALLGQDAVVLMTQTSRGSSATVGRNLMLAQETFLMNQLNAVKWTGVDLRGKEEKFRSYSVWERFVLRVGAIGDHVQCVTSSTSANNKEIMTSGIFALIKQQGLATFAWSDQPDSSDSMKTLLSKECAETVRQHLGWVTEKWQGPINAEILLRILRNCGTWADAEKDKPLIRVDRNAPSVARQLLFLSVHGDEVDKGDIWMYGMPKADEEGDKRAVYEQFSPAAILKLRLGPIQAPEDGDVDRNLFPPEGSRALVWATLSACKVAHKLTGRDLDKSCASIREEKYYGIDPNADREAAGEPTWLGVFASQIILGWDGNPHTATVKQFWKEFFVYMGTKKKSLKATLDAGEWGYVKRNETWSWILILRVLKHPDYDKDQADTTLWHWFDVFPRKQKETSR